MFVGHVADAALLGLEALAVDLFGDHLGPADLQLVALAAHRLDEHGELQLAAAGDLDDVGRIGAEQLDRDVAEQLAVEPVDEVPAGEELAVLAGERRGVDPERHPQHGLVDDQPLQRDGVLDAGDGVADLHLGEAGDDEQIAGRQLLDLVAADALERHQLAEAALQRRLPLAALLLEQGDGLAAAQHAVVDAPDGQAAEVLGCVERGDERLQWRGGVALRLGDAVEDGVEQRRQVGVGAGHADAEDGPALASHRRDDLEVDVVVMPASGSMNSWYTSSRTSSARASWRSTLLMMTIAGRSRASAFDST